MFSLFFISSLLRYVILKSHFFLLLTFIVIFMFEWRFAIFLRFMTFIIRNAPNNIPPQHCQRLFRFMGINTKENISNIFVEIIANRFFSSRMFIHKISEIYHLLLIETEVTLTLFCICYPLLSCTLHCRMEERNY